jgi:hypothetical protein
LASYGFEAAKRLHMFAFGLKNVDPIHGCTEKKLEDVFLESQWLVRMMAVDAWAKADGKSGIEFLTDPDGTVYWRVSRRNPQSAKNQVDQLRLLETKA